MSRRNREHGTLFVSIFQKYANHGPQFYLDLIEYHVPYVLFYRFARFGPDEASKDALSLLTNLNEFANDIQEQNPQIMVTLASQIGKLHQQFQHARLPQDIIDVYNMFPQSTEESLDNPLTDSYDDTE